MFVVLNTANKLLTDHFSSVYAIGSKVQQLTDS